MIEQLDENSFFEPVYFSLNMTDKNDYKLGITWQDIQHRRIVEIINELNSNPRVDFKVLFNELNFFIKDHFDTEERYMHELAYDKTEAHIEDHKTFAKKIYELSVKCFVDKELHSNLLSFLNDWFLNHILVVDKDLATFLIKYEYNNDLQSDN